MYKICLVGNADNYEKNCDLKPTPLLQPITT